jgi:hypothetical protein
VSIDCALSATIAFVFCTSIEVIDKTSALVASSSFTDTRMLSPSCAMLPVTSVSTPAILPS